MYHRETTAELNRTQRIVRAVSMSQWGTVPEALAIAQLASAKLDASWDEHQAALRELMELWPETFGLETVTSAAV